MPIKMTLDDLPSLRMKHVHIKNEAAVLKTINRIIEGGVDRLQIVSDFDLTLTKQHVNGKQVLSSFGIFQKCDRLPPNYLDESKRLYNKYRPIEIDPHLSIDQKTEAMNSWMSATQNLLCGIDFDPAEINRAASKYGTALRDGTKEFLKKLNDSDVPVLVFSAGLGDVVEAVLRCHGVLYQNVRVISNFLKYNSRRLDGFKNSDRLIHVFNKNEFALEHEYFKVIRERKNVLLMGDSVGDATMVNGMEDTDAVLKIGFLYDHVEKSLASYMEVFDIVLVDDQSMNVPMDILRPIL